MMATRIDLIGQRAMNTVVSHQRGVKASVKAHALPIFTQASARLEMAKHRTHISNIFMETADVDTLVGLEDVAALSIEFGHFLGPRELGAARRYIEGLHTLRGYRYSDGVA
jgi:hypothetical protein